MKTGLISLYWVADCGAGDPNAHAAPTCSVRDLEATRDTQLTQAASDVDFSFSVERPGGGRYNFSRGTSSLQTSYESASTSKLVTAVSILRLVEQGYLSLTDRPQDRIPTWPIRRTNPLYHMSLEASRYALRAYSFTLGEGNLRHVTWPRRWLARPVCAV